MARDVVQELTEIMTQKLKLPPSAVEPETPLFEGGLELDSFAVVELVTTFETHFGIELADEDFAPENFKNLRVLSNVIEKYLPAEAN